MDRPGNLIPVAYGLGTALSAAVVSIFTTPLRLSADMTTTTLFKVPFSCIFIWQILDTLAFFNSGQQLLLDLQGQSLVEIPGWGISYLLSWWGGIHSQQLFFLVYLCHCLYWLLPACGFSCLVLDLSGQLTMKKMEMSLLEKTYTKTCRKAKQYFLKELKKPGEQF